MVRLGLLGRPQSLLRAGSFCSEPLRAGLLRISTMLFQFVPFNTDCRAVLDGRNLRFLRSPMLIRSDAEHEEKGDLSADSERPGAARIYRTVIRSTRFTPEEWATVQERAAAVGLSPS